MTTRTVQTRQTLVDQVEAPSRSKLQSELDLNFSQVNLSQAKLLQVDAQSNLDAARVALAAVLGSDHITDYRLVDDPGPLPNLPPAPDGPVKEALENRPDLQALQLSTQADQKFATAQKRQLLPTVTAAGVVGYTPPWVGSIL